MFDIIYDNILSSTFNRIKNYPVFIIQFLFYIIVDSIILLVGGWFIQNLFYCQICHVNYSFSVIILSIAFLISFLLYLSFWNLILENVKSSVPQILDNVLKDIDKFVREVVDNTIFERLRDEMSRIPFLKIALVLVSYISSWVFGLYLLDGLLILLTGHSVFIYLINNVHVLVLIAVASVLVSQIINPWEYQRKEKPSSNATSSTQYQYAFLERLEEVLTGKVEYPKERRFLEPAIRYLEAVLALPAPKGLEKLFIVDLFQVPYVKSNGSSKSRNTRYTGNIIEEMLKETPSIIYKLEPFEERCKSVPKAEVLSVRSACWYKVKMTKKTDNNSWESIGYAMILVIGPPGDIKRSVKVLRLQFKGSDQYCYYILRNLEKLCLIQDTAIILLIGKEELLGIKYFLS